MPLWLLTLAARALSGVKALFRWFTENPWRLALLAIAVLALLYWRADARADRLALDVKAERAAHAETLASVKKLRDALDAKNAETIARAKAFDDAQRKGVAVTEQARRDFAPTERRIATVRASAGQGTDKCEVPTDVAELLR